MLNRFAKDWHRLSSSSEGAGEKPEWVLCVLAAMAWGCAALMALGHGLTWTYQPWGGVLGHPTYLDYAPGQEMFYYFTGLTVIAALGLAFFVWVARSRHGFALGLGLLASGGLSAAGVVLLMPNPAAELVKSIIRAPLAFAEALIAGVLVIALACGGQFFRQAESAAAEASALRVHKTRRLADDWAEILARWVPSFLIVLLLGVAFIPDNLVAGILALLMAFVFERIYRPIEDARSGVNITVCLETFLWAVAGVVLPALGWWARLRLTQGQWLPDPCVPVLSLFALMGLITLVGLLRRRLRLESWVHPAWLSPLILFTTMVLGMGEIANYDAFHQGEFIYSAEAMRAGLLPWRDIFFVHGFGVNTLLGWLAGQPRLELYNIDISLICMVGAVSKALVCWLLLGMWGRRWWLVVIMTVLLCSGNSQTPHYRYFVLWIVLLLVMGFLKGRRLRWLTLAGAGCVGACLYSLDLGGVLVIAMPVWLLLWHGWHPGGVFARRRAVEWLMPLGAWLLGVTLAGLAFLAWLGVHGMVADFFTLHLEYLRAKPHADKIPFEITSLAFLVSPITSLLGIWASALILRRCERSPLAGFVVLLTLINVLLFSRALDRSDAGHIIYATVVSWVLMGSLMVWRCRAVTKVASFASREALVRSALLVAVMLLLPYAHPLIRGNSAHRVTLTVPLVDWIPFYSASVRKGLVREVDDEISRDFFDLAAQLRERINPADGFYDFSNQPAIYVWTGTKSPTRFYAAYYAYGDRWQREVIDALEEKRVRWVLWKGPNPYFNFPDGVPNYVRQWRVASYILAHYRPAYRLAGGSLLAERIGWGETAETDQTERPSIQRDWVRLKWIPQVWGRSEEGVPPVPGETALALDLETKDGRIDCDVPEALQPDRERPVRELLVYVDPAPEGAFQLMWWGSAKGFLRFNLREGYAGPYRVTLHNLPNWVWGGPIRDLQIKVLREDNRKLSYDVKVRLDFRR